MVVAGKYNGIKWPLSLLQVEVQQSNRTALELTIVSPNAPQDVLWTEILKLQLAHFVLSPPYRFSILSRKPPKLLFFFFFFFFCFFDFPL
jgi:hypothetical protein